MFKEITGIKIKNVFFNPEANIELFSFNKNRNHQVSVIYGRNGTGKSTIAKSILNYKKPLDSVEMKFVNKNNDDISFDNDISEHIYVYNEDFMEEKVKFRENDSMNAIVLLGEQVEYDKIIKELNGDLSKENIKLKNINIELYEDIKNTLNPEYHLNKLRTKLQETLGEREKNFRKLSRRSSITDDIINEAKIFKTKKSLDIMVEEYKELLNKYELVSGDDIDLIDKESINFEKPKVDLPKIKRLLSIKLEKPLSNEIVNKIKLVLERDGVQTIKEIDSYFRENKSDVCPFCFRDYNQQFSEELIKNINVLLNDELETHQEELDRVKLVDVNKIETNNIEEIGHELIEGINKTIGEYNKEVLRINKIIDSKKNNPYEVKIIETNILNIITDLNNSYKKIIAQIESINKDITNKSKILNDLRDKNKEYAFIESIDIIKEYKKTFNKYNIVKNDQNNILKNIREIEAKIQHKESLKANIQIATSLMNTWLNNIFMEKDRIKLVCDGDKYNILSRGEPIRLKDLSNGERNAVSLAYFFAKLIEGGTVEDLESKPIFLVLDDPLTSFDFEYKLGILSFLKMVIEKTLNNTSSKILLFTHQLDAAYSLSNMIDDCEKSNRNNSKKQLVNKQTIEFSIHQNMYIKLLNAIGQFIIDDENNNEHLIPNKIRRVLESFAVFNFGVSISQVSTDGVIINNIKSAKIKEYYKNNLYKITLNTGSHLRESTYGIEEGMLLDTFSTEQINNIAKDVILLIKELNPAHFEYIFRNENDVVEAIANHKQHIESLNEM